MEHGRIVKPYNGFYNFYVTIEYHGEYLLVSLDDLNRYDDLGTTDQEIKKDTGMFITDMPVKTMIENYIEINDIQTTKLESFSKGMIIQHNYTGDIFGLICARERPNGSLYLYRLLFDTFEIHKLCTYDDHDAIESIASYYDKVEMNFQDLQFKINGGV